MFSIVAPIDTNRLEQFKVAKQIYDEMPEKKEFVMPTRSYKEVYKYLQLHRLSKDVRLIPYEHSRGFNPSKALNLGVKNAKSDHIIITSPEVKPPMDFLEKLSEVKDKNILCQVTDQQENGNLTVLVSSSFRGHDPSMYFLALFQKKDIETINGWDEDFMRGYAYEDNDFGSRWLRAGLTFEFRDDIVGTHLYHPRHETIKGGTQINLQKYNENNRNSVIRCQNGLTKLQLS